MSVVYWGMNNNSNNNTVVVQLPFDAKSYGNLQELAQASNMSITNVISKALSIVQLARGRHLIIQEKGNEIDKWEVNTFRDLPSAPFSANGQ